MEKNLLARQVGEDDNAALHRRVFSITSSTAWPNAEIKYKWNSDSGEKELAEALGWAIENWHDGAEYLEFMQIRHDFPTPMEGVLTILTQPCVGSSSMIGYKGAGDPDDGIPNMQLQRSCDQPGSSVDGLVLPSMITDSLMKLNTH